MATTLSYAHGTSSTALLGENLRRTVERHGERLASGVGKGGRVGIWSERGVH
jgi:hypothetical protein